MNVAKIKQYLFTLALLLTFVVAPGLSNLAAVQAKDSKEKDRKEKRYKHDDDDDDRDEWRERRRRRHLRFNWWLYQRRFDRFHPGFGFRPRF